MDTTGKTLAPEPLRVPLSQHKANPGGYLDTAHQRRVLLTGRGKVVGELVPRVEAPLAPVKPLHRVLKHMLTVSPDADVTAPGDASCGAID